MAALRPDQAKTGAAGATIGTPETQSAVTPRSFNARATTRIDRNEFGVTAYRGLAVRYLDMTLEVRCVRN
jgi:hypothetical protein